MTTKKLLNYITELMFMSSQSQTEKLSGLTRDTLTLALTALWTLFIYSQDTINLTLAHQEI